MIDKVYTAPLLTDIITVNDTGTTINWDTNKYEYEAFIFSNLGKTYQLGIEINGNLIKIPSRSTNIFEQEEITSFKLKCLESGKTTEVFYFVQGFEKRVQG